MSKNIKKDSDSKNKISFDQVVSDILKVKPPKKRSKKKKSKDSEETRK